MGNGKISQAQRGSTDLVLVCRVKGNNQKIMSKGNGVGAYKGMEGERGDGASCA